MSRRPTGTRASRGATGYGVGGRGVHAYAGTHEIVTGAVDLVPDGHDPDGWWVHVNGVPSSYVHLADPTILVFEYVRWIGDLIDVLAPAGEPLRTAHLGGAGCTLARYVAATRPGSPQAVYEVDPALVDLMRTALGLRRRDGFRIKAMDARAGIGELWPGSQDLVIRDAFLRDQVPAHLTTVEFARQVADALAPGGVYVANVADGAWHSKGGAERNLARVEAATLREVFDVVAVVGEPAQLRGRRYGNILLIAGFGDIPLDAMARRLASGAIRARLVGPDRLAELTAGLRPVYDPPEPAADPSEPGPNSSRRG